MGGGLMQLVAYGAQDVYLTGDPQITYFKVVYRRHTNFSMECIEQTFNGTPGNGNKVSCTISRNGDLIGAMHLEVPRNGQAMSATPATFANIISEVEVEIGGQKIDKHYGKWLDIWYGLTTPESKPIDQLIPTGTSEIGYVPLQFWFNRNVGLALPLIALQYHEVKLNITFGDSNNNANTPASVFTMADAKLWVDYIYLDTEERKRFAQMSHEYLIDQLQFPGQETGGTKYRLNFNHPVKELVWNTQTLADGTAGFAAGTTWKLMLNGHDRFAARESTYFTRLQKYYHHTSVNGGSCGGGDDVHVYSFALRPEEHQPSGTCNFSRIDNATLTSSAAPAGSNGVDIYAVNYNVLRVVSGMGGLAYSN